MKTVMKKIGCLLLVAVLMVSAVPVAFAAPAANTACPDHPDITAIYSGTVVTAGTCTTEGSYKYNCPGDGASNIAHTPVVSAKDPDNHTSWDVGVVTTPATCTTEGVKTYTCGCGETRDEAIAIDPTAHNHGEGVVTTKPTCKATGVKTFTCACGDSYTGTIPIDPNAHNLVDGVCNICGYCETCHGTNGSHTADCDHNPYKEKVCDNCGKTYTDAVGHTCCERCKEEHATENCRYCAVCWPELNTTHTTAQHCAECDTVNGHKSTCPKYDSSKNGTHTLKVYANLYVGGVENGTVLLDTIYNLYPSENVHDVITANKSRLEAKIGENSAYQWSGHFYKEKNTQTIIGTSAMTVEDTPEVYINLYRSEKSVVVRVHTSKSYVVDNSVEVHGFHVDDVITSKDVLRALQAKYSISSLKMYTTAQWDRVVQGKSATTIANHVVTEGDNIIHAYISGSSKTTSTAKADSSNYKTGDAIFTYVTVMVASVSCLAAVLYLKKKCAVK